MEPLWLHNYWWFHTAMQVRNFTIESWLGFELMSSCAQNDSTLTVLTQRKIKYFIFHRFYFKRHNILREEKVTGRKFRDLFLETSATFCAVNIFITLKIQILHKKMSKWCQIKYWNIIMWNWEYRQSVSCLESNDMKLIVFNRDYFILLSVLFSLTSRLSRSK